MQTKKDFIESLSPEQKKAFLQLEKKNKSIKKPALSYVEKNIEMFEKFFAGETSITDFMRDSRSKKVESQLRYFFSRKPKTNIKGEETSAPKFCFQFKTFISDLLMAKAILEGLDEDGNSDGWQQRFAVMRYELVKHLQGSRKKKRAGSGVEILVAKDGKDETLNESIATIKKAKAKLEKVVVAKEEVDMSAFEEIARKPLKAGKKPLKAGKIPDFNEDEINARRAADGLPPIS